MKTIIDQQYIYDAKESFEDFLKKYLIEKGVTLGDSDYLGKVKIIVEILED